MTPAGFPHSEISGSQLVCSSPELIAAYHVLHRLLTPRHPPSALSSLIEILGARSRLLFERLSERRQAVLSGPLRSSSESLMQLSKIDARRHQAGRSKTFKRPRQSVDLEVRSFIV